MKFAFCSMSAKGEATMLGTAPFLVLAAHKKMLGEQTK
tara:strand:+ start:507 stop:620 length:114 start_codon:yes stop_codon:yes gene_type:complete